MNAAIKIKYPAKNRNFAFISVFEQQNYTENRRLIKIRFYE